MICCWLSLLSLTLSTDARYLFRQVVFRSHLLTPASHLGSPKGSPHPPTSLLLHVVAVLLVQLLTLQDTLFCVQCRALAFHSLPVSPHITLHQSPDPLPLYFCFIPPCITSPLYSSPCITSPLSVPPLCLPLPLSSQHVTH